MLGAHKFRKGQRVRPSKAGKAACRARSASAVLTMTMREPTAAEIRAAARAIAIHQDGAGIHPGSTRLTDEAIAEWNDLALTALRAAAAVRTLGEPEPKR